MDTKSQQLFQKFLWNSCWLFRIPADQQPDSRFLNQHARDIPNDAARYIRILFSAICNRIERQLF